MEAIVAGRATFKASTMAAPNYDASAAMEVLRKLRNVVVGAAADGMTRWTA